MIWEAAAVVHSRFVEPADVWLAGVPNNPSMDECVELDFRRAVSRISIPWNLSRDCLLMTVKS
jgi:hypothetical protein